MDSKNYTNIDTSDYQKKEQSQKNSTPGQSPLNKNIAYITLTILIGISLIITMLIFSKNSTFPTISKINSGAKVTLHNTPPVKKTALNSADISDKNIFDKSTYDKSKEVKLPPPKNPYEKKVSPTPSPKPTAKPKAKAVVIAKKPSSTPQPTATNTPTSTPKPTATIVPSATPTPTRKPTATVMPSATPTPTRRPTVTVTPKATATPTVVITKKPTVTSKPTVTVAQPTIIAQKPTAAPVKTTQAQSDSYIVKNGDNLWIIAEAFYGTGFKASDIAKVNKLTQANLIYVGQKLILPKTTVNAETKTVAKAEPTKVQAVKKDTTLQGKPEILAANTKNTDKVQKYTVVAGDNLWDIAVKFYGDGFAWRKIAEANKLANPRVIHKGNVLSIPAKS